MERDESVGSLDSDDEAVMQHLSQEFSAHMEDIRTLGDENFNLDKVIAAVQKMPRLPDDLASDKNPYRVSIPDRARANLESLAAAFGYTFLKRQDCKQAGEVTARTPVPKHVHPKH